MTVCKHKIVIITKQEISYTDGVQLLIEHNNDIRIMTISPTNKIGTIKEYI